MAKGNPPTEVHRLVERFARDAAVLRSPQFKEEQLRLEFLNPFFEALGWDVSNKAGLSETYKPVIHEESIRVAGATKAPDYTFRVGGRRVFFAEAKKPAVRIAEDPGPAFQLRRYAWTAKLPVSILTDFEQFAVYDSRIRPFPADKAATARTMLVGYAEYATRWEELAGLFSPDAIQKGALERYVESSKSKKGTAAVDDAFLREISRWRELLAKNIALRNPRLSTRELNFAVQRTIDRIIFLRICEDRGIEHYAYLQSLLNGPNVYERLTKHFRDADDRYNSGLFHFSPEKERSEAPDRLSLDLDIDDKALKDIIGNLYYPDSPYEFSVMPADVLGRVYEQFLGKVIRLTAGHQAKVEEKPEVRKAGGVYYTPTYIVDYIVRNTVGKLVEGKSPENVAKLRILDPACGSGSFLLGAYQFLLDWHLDYYQKTKGQESGTRRQGPTHRDSKGNLRLTTAERKRILLNNIYGVDIDAQAVEVTKLSLLLKVLEGENEETLSSQLKFFRERALPDLSSNIKCGNSLIGPDFYQGEQQALFGNEEERLRINVFDWNAGFPDVMKAGGFDAVIGNPPYIRVQAMNEWSPESLPYFGRNYIAAGKGNYDIYVVFVEKGLSLLNRDGVLGFILPHKFFNSQYGAGLRGLIAKGKNLAQVVHFGHQQVFENATTYTCLMFLTRLASARFLFAKVDDLDSWQREGKTDQGFVLAKGVAQAEWNFSLGKNAELLAKLGSLPVKLSDVTSRIFQGIKTSADKIYIVEERQRKKAKVKVYSPQLEEEVWLEPDLLHPLIKGGDSRRYHMSRTDRLILFPYAPRGHLVELVSPDEMESRFPLTWRYLVANREYLKGREHGKMRGHDWYAYGRNQALDVMHLPKLFTPDIALSAAFSLDESGKAFFTGGVAGGYGLLVLPAHSREYVLGLLNSKLLDWCVKQVATQMRGGWYSFESRFIRDLPIRVCDLNDRSDKARHDKMVELVERMLDLHKQSPKARTPHERESIERTIAATDKTIDALVYELYGLTDDEIRIVEGQQR